MNIRYATFEEVKALHQVFEASVRHFCSAHYSNEQIEAWVARADLQRWQELFDSQLRFFVAEDVEQQRLAGFASFQADGYLHSMFVHPHYGRRGVATLLLQAVEAMVDTRIHSEVSITARPFFEKAGYMVVNEQTVVVGGVEMTNFVMQKQLTEQ